MKRIIFTAACIMSVFFIVSCGDQGSGNAANKPTNSANASNTPATSTDHSADEAAVKKTLSDLAASMVKNDVDAADKAYSDNYMFVGPDGSVATKAERIAAMKSGDTKYDTLTYDEVTVRVNPEGNGAVSISRATVKGKNMGKAVDGQYRVTHVWTKTKDGWKMASGQTTAITAASAKPNDQAPAINTNAAKSPPAATNK
ncbi:MAG: nuclear transport factor 2 family protein [Acidobacteriota bacterium]